MISILFFLLFFAAVMIFAAWRGGGPERATVIAFLIALAGSASVGIIRMPGRFHVVPVQLFAVDVLLLIVMCIIAIRANRLWPIPTAGCQLVAVLVHMAKLIDPQMIPNGYAFLVTIWSWPMVLLLAIGTGAHQKRLKDAIIFADWKCSSLRSRSRIRQRQQHDCVQDSRP